MTIEDRKLGWMAGVIDLKGRLVNKNNRMRASRQILLAVESKEFAVVRELSALIGTRPELQNAKPLKDFMRRGCMEHCPEQHVHVHEEYGELMMPPVGRFTVTGASMVVVLQNLMPLLMIDRGYQEAIAEVESTVPLTGQGSGQVLVSLRRLKALSWDLPPHYEEAIARSATANTVQSRPATALEIAQIIAQEQHRAQVRAIGEQIADQHSSLLSRLA